MKKSLIALAIFGAFAGAASAQSNVTLYGIVDAGLQYKKGADKTAPTTSQFGVDGGYVAGNRWGLRGTEALGNGLNAIFTLESGFDIDRGTSAQGGRLFGRQAWAGLNGGFGNVVFGRIATFSSGTGSFDMFGAVDPFGTGWGLNSAGSTFLSANATRADNTVAYVTPTWGGFKAGAAYSFNLDGTEAAGSSNNTRVMALGASYAVGPFYGVVTYDSIAFPSKIGGSDQKHLQVGGSFDLKFVKLSAAYANQSNVRALLPSGLINSATTPSFAAEAAKPGNVVAPVGGFDADSYLVGANVPLFGGNLLASWQMLDGDKVGTFQAKYSVYSVGYGYPLSKRTSLYAGYGKRTADGSLPTTFEGQQGALGVNHKF